MRHLPSPSPSLPLPAWVRTASVVALALVAACTEDRDSTPEVTGANTQGIPQTGDDTNGSTGSAGDDSADPSTDPTQSDSGSTSGDPTTSGPPPGVMVAPNGYYTEGNTIYDYGGNPVVFHGMSRPSLEWNPAGENLSLNPPDYRTMAEWGANIVRLPLNQQFWLPGSADHDAGYQARVDAQVNAAKAAGLAVILDLHWSDKGNAAGPGGQQIMADSRSVMFWTDVATKYKDDGQVIFELYNEPKMYNDWNLWKSGGMTDEGWQAVGFQQLYDTVRAAGAHNLVIIGGIDWAWDLSRVPQTPITGYNIAYATHPYPYNTKMPDRFDYAFGNTAQMYPVIATEFGPGTGDITCQESYTTDFLEYAAQRNISWVAWAWYPGTCEFPSLISNWNGTPTSFFGETVRAAM